MGAIENGPTIDWDAALDMTPAQLDRAIDAWTGIVAEPDAYGYVTGEARTASGSREYRADMTHRRTLAMLDARAVADDATSPMGALAMRAAHVLPTISDALLMSAVMHAPDVLAASGRVVGTRLAQYLAGADWDAMDDAQRDAYARDVRDTLPGVLGDVAEAILADGQARPAVVRRVPVVDAAPIGQDVATRRPIYPAGARVLGTTAVVVDAGEDRETLGHADNGAPLFPFMVPSTRRARRDAARLAYELVDDVPAGDARGYARPGRRAAVAMDSNGYPYRLGYEPCQRVYGPTLAGPAGRGTVVHAWYGNSGAGRLATLATGDLGRGVTVGPFGNVRDALGRVSLASGATVTRERLLSPLTGKRETTGTTARETTRRAPIVTRAVKGRATLAALRRG